MKRVPWPPHAPWPSHEGERIMVAQETAHYVRDVLRMEAGRMLEFFDGQGHVAWALLTQVGAQGVEIQWQRAQVTTEKESPLRLTLFQAIPKGARWESILEKTTELGVTKVVPVMSHRTVVKITPEKAPSKHIRWQKIATSAARQCGRTMVPKIDEPVGFETALSMATEPVQLVAALVATAPLPQTLPAEGGALGVWIGPEGGWAPQELDALWAHGALGFTLGPRVLRVDTAAISAVALCQQRWGDM